MQQYKIKNPIFEVDLAGCSDDDKKQRMKELLKIRIDYACENLASDAKILINIRDLAPAMIRHPLYVFEVVKMLATMPENKRPFGIIFEEPTGRYLPEQLGAWTKSLRELMDECDWKSAHLLVHIHKKWEMAEVAQLECLACGADGVWASVCEEGAALGHACSVITIMNLIRMGNTKVLAKYNCTHLREAAIRVTEITTGQPPHPKQTIYGERALDVVFDTTSGMGATTEEPDSNNPFDIFNLVQTFDMSKFFGIKAPTRVSTLATPAMVRDRLIELFGEHEDFTEEIAVKMKALMIEDLDANKKEEYMSDVGIAVLFKRAGGSLTAEMTGRLEKHNMEYKIHKKLIEEVREIWDTWHFDKESDRETLSYFSFYSAFMSPYFSSYSNADVGRPLKAMNLVNESGIPWKEFSIYLKWALSEYPDTATAEDLLSTAFTKALIPIMQTEIMNRQGELIGPYSARFFS